MTGHKYVENVRMLNFVKFVNFDELKRTKNYETFYDNMQLFVNMLTLCRNDNN